MGSSGLHVLEFYGGDQDGFIAKIGGSPEAVIIFKIIGSKAIMMKTGEPQVAPPGTIFVSYDFWGIDDAGRYRYVEHQMKENAKDTDLWFA